MKSRLALLSLVLLLASAKPVHAQYVAQQVATGLSSPVSVTSPPGDPRLFAVELAGRIWIVAGVPNPPVLFLDITDRVKPGGERGLLGLAFSPSFGSDGEFYVRYTRDFGAISASTVSRFAVDAVDPDLGDPTSEEIVLDQPQACSQHLGGHLAFGPDDLLYVAFGDGKCDPADAQDLSKLQGTILRIDVTSTPTPPATYVIPPDNPFVGVPGAREEIWVYGLRNPWRFSFDRLTGDLFIGDVGATLWEEIDFQPFTSAGGENYGWPITEGPVCNDPPVGCVTTGITSAVIEIPTQGSITGGYRYRGPAPSLQGTYFFAQWPNDGPYAAEAWWPPGSFVHQPISISADVGSVGSIVSFGEDAAGELYVVDFSGGEVFRLLGRDGDGDGLLDDVDNCPDAANPLQGDVDGDGTGNACDAQCANGIDDDLDGDVDHPDDAACLDWKSGAEGPQCDDGVDNEGDGYADWDGAGISAADPECTGPTDVTEYQFLGRGFHCGLGFELVVLIPLLAALRLRRAARA